MSPREGRARGYAVSLRQAERRRERKGSEDWVPEAVSQASVAPGMPFHTALRGCCLETSWASLRSFSVDIERVVRMMDIDTGASNVKTIFTHIKLSL